MVTNQIALEQSGQSLYFSYRWSRELSWLGADLYFSTELADLHRTKVLATQCLGRADLTAQNLQKHPGSLVSGSECR